jgi:transposase-like protein
MNECPHCQRTDRQVKNGKTAAGSQVIKCKVCNRKYTPAPKRNGHQMAKREQVLRLVLDGNSQRQAARHAGVSHGSVANWLKAYADGLPATLPTPETPVEVAEQDELFTFLGEKKTKPTS